MIATFERETKPLDKKELQAIEPIISFLKVSAVGKINIKTNERIAKIYCYNLSKGIMFSPARIRKILNHIRTNGLIKNLIASGNGYYIATSRAEVRDYLMKQLQGRAEAIAQLFNSYDFSLEMEIKIKEKHLPIRTNIIARDNVSECQQQLFND